MARQKKKRKRLVRLQRQLHRHGTNRVAKRGWPKQQASNRMENKSGRRGRRSADRSHGFQGK